MRHDFLPIMALFNLRLKIMSYSFKYADLLDDDVFKLVFGRESTKDVMIEFLNQVIPDRKIEDLDFIDKEMHPVERDLRGSVYDMSCRTDDGSRVIVEVQRRKQPFYPERALYYSTFQIQRQVEAGAEEYDFLPVYVVNIMNFIMDHNLESTEVKTVYRLLEENTHRLLTDRVTFIFLELPKFQKRLEDLDGNILEGMYFCFKNMAILGERPEVLTHKIFSKIFEVSELYNMDKVTRDKILHKMTTERDLRNQMAWARKEAIEEGLAEGRAEGRAEGSMDKALEIAGKMKALGVDLSIILQASGLTEDQVAAL